MIEVRLRLVHATKAQLRRLRLGCCLRGYELVNVVSETKSSVAKDRGIRTQLQDVSNGTHHDETDTHGLADLDELLAVGYSAG